MSYTYSRLFFLLIKKQMAKMSKNVLFSKSAKQWLFPCQEIYQLLEDYLFLSTCRQVGVGWEYT